MRVAGLSLSPLPEPAIVHPPAIEQRIDRRRTDPVGQGEFELDLTGEFLTDDFLTDDDRNHVDALLESLGDAAAQAESESEAEALVGAMVPLAAEITPGVNTAMLRVAPNLLTVLATATRVLYPNRQTRPLLRTLPSVLHHTATDLQKQLRQGKPITARSAVQALANQTYRILKDPQRTQKALHHAHSVQQRYLR
jgi:hypothetical protein